MLDVLRAEKKIKFCIIIPSRNRPAQVETALRHYSSEEFSDVVILLQDNSDVKYTFDGNVLKLLEGRFEHRKSTSILSMDENWNQAYFEALRLNCDFYLLTTDKVILKSGFISYLRSVIRDYDCDAFEWMAKPTKRYQIQPFLTPVSLAVHMYEPVSMVNAFLREGWFGFEGAPLGHCTCISAELLRSVFSQFGRACWPGNPDYTFAYLALSVRGSFKYGYTLINGSEILMGGDNRSIGNGASYVQNGLDKTGEWFTLSARQSAKLFEGERVWPPFPKRLRGSLWSIILSDWMCLARQLNTIPLQFECYGARALIRELYWRASLGFRLCEISKSWLSLVLCRRSYRGGKAQMMSSYLLFPLMVGFGWLRRIARESKRFLFNRTPINRP